MSTLLQDVRFALRSFGRTPAVVASALASIAVGIGASTAMFSVAHALFLRPLPYPDPARLAILWNRSPGLGIAEDWFSTAQYFDIRHGHSGFEQVAIAIGANDTLTGDGEPERLGTLRVSSNLLSMLGARAETGRLLVAADDLPGASPVAILGYGTWLRRYGADPGVVGRSITVNGQPHQVVGVLAARFLLPRDVMPTLDGAEDAEVVLPLPLPAGAAGVRTREDYNVLAKLKPGVTLAQAQAEMDALTARLRRDHPDVYPPNGGLTFDIVPLQDQVVGAVRRPMALLVAAVACVLMVACANVANLLLARAVARQRELAVRQAIGAGRGRLVRQLLTESVVLAVAGGGCGLGLAFGLVAVIRRFGAGSVPRLHEVSVDLPVLGFTLAASVGAGVAFGLVPALRAGSADIHESLKEGARGTAGASMWGRGHTTRRLLVVSELALAVMLLVGAGLLGRSFAALLAVDPGFRPEGVLTLELTMTGRKYGDAEKVLDGYRRLWAGLAAVPGVTSAGAVSALPLSRMFSWGPITVEGRMPPPGEKFINVDQRIVAGGYFEAMGIPLVAGRVFHDRDTRAADRVVIVDELMAAQLWPSQPAIGRRLRLGGADSTSPWATVVGVVGRVKQYTLDADSRMAMYLAHTQFPARPMNVVIRGGGTDPAALTGSVRRVLADVDPDLPMYRVRTMDARIAESMATRRFALLLLGAFAAVALGLASVGIAGVMSYVVSQGTRDLGIRLALGATPADLVRLVVGQGMAVASVGVVLGVAGAYAASRLIGSLLYGVAPADPLTFTGVVALLAAVALGACYGPSRRAARIDPMVAMRSE